MYKPLQSHRWAVAICATVVVPLTLWLERAATGHAVALAVPRGRGSLALEVKLRGQVRVLVLERTCCLLDVRPHLLAGRRLWMDLADGEGSPGVAGVGGQLTGLGIVDATNNHPIPARHTVDLEGRDLISGPGDLRLLRLAPCLDLRLLFHALALFARHP